MTTYPTNPTLRLEEVTLYWKTQLTLKSISFEAQENEIISILGPSGCGKSTLLHIVAGLLLPSSGKLIIHGKECTGKTGFTGYMQQQDLLFPWKTILENAALPLLLQGKNRAESFDEASSHFEDFGLAGYQQYLPDELSGGMRQRAALLRTHMMKKKILLLDEPFGALDSLTRKTMQIWLLAMYTTLQSTILLVTHDLEEAIFLSDRILTLSNLPGSITDTFSVQTPREQRRKDFFLSPEMIDLKKSIYRALL